MIKLYRSASTIAVALLVLGLLAWNASCGNARRAGVRNALHATNVLRDGFSDWDFRHQRTLVEEAPSLEAAKESIDKYRAKRQHVVDSFEVVYRLLALAATEPTADNIGVALRAAGDLADAVRRLQEGL